MRMRCVVVAGILFHCDAQSPPLAITVMSSIALPSGGAAAADVDDDIDGVPLQPLPSAAAWLPQSVAVSQPVCFVPASLPITLPVPVINPVRAALLAAGITPALPVNRVEQERAAAEDKKRRQDEEAKAVYADFVASFAAEPSQQQQPVPSRSKPNKSPFTAFVRGGTIGGDNSTAAATAPASTPAAAKRPEPAQASSPASAAVEPPWKRLRPASPPRPLPVEAAFPPPAAPTAGRGKLRNIDLFLAELKQRQADPQSVREDAQPAMPTTTNVYIAGLPLSTTESDLADEMVRFGDIASVKLLYPRSEEELARPTMNGFVAYMLRRDAEDAMREMNNSMWRSHPLKLHWSKPITLPSTPAATKASRRAAATNQFVVELPADPSTRSVIDQLALQVSQHGLDYEQSILEQHAHAARTAPNHPYSFLYQLNSSANLYYRWRTHSLRAGHTLARWDTRPFPMIPHGPLWLPPVDGANVRVAQEGGQEAASGRAGPGEDGVGLSGAEVEDMQRVLGGVTLQRSSILAAMGWCLEHAAAAAFIVRSICAALLSPSADSCRRVALLFLLSDLLYNSSAPVRNASLYRREAGRPNALHGVWEAFSPPQLYTASTRYKDGGNGQPASAGQADEQRRRAGRTEREVALTVLRTWQTWSLFEDSKIEQWMRGARGLPSAPAAQVPALLSAAGIGFVENEDGAPLR